MHLTGEWTAAMTACSNMTHVSQPFGHSWMPRVVASVSTNRLYQMRSIFLLLFSHHQTKCTHLLRLHTWMQVQSPTWVAGTGTQATMAGSSGTGVQAKARCTDDLCACVAHGPIYHALRVQSCISLSPLVHSRYQLSAGSVVSVVINPTTILSKSLPPPPHRPSLPPS